VVGFVSLVRYEKLSWGVWIKNLQRKPVHNNIPRYLLKAASALFVVCVSAYTALLIYEWKFISWFWVFGAVTIVVLLSAVGNLYWQIYWGRRLDHTNSTGLTPQRDERQDTDGL